jgi:hyperosmotically inducible periplasmic protein
MVQAVAEEVSTTAYSLLTIVDRTINRTMRRLTLLLLSSFVVMSAIACGPAETSNNAPNSTEQANTNTDKSTAQTNQNDAVSETRRKQLNSDIRAREQRNKIAGDETVRDDGDLASEVRSKLEANLPASALAVDAKDGTVTVSGTVVDNTQLQKIEPLAKEIKGVKSVQVKAATNSAAKPEAPKPETAQKSQEHTGSN